MKDGTVQMKNDLKVGDHVKLIFDEKVQIVDVLSVSEKSFTTGLTYTGDVFVYGREGKKISEQLIMRPSVC